MTMEYKFKSKTSWVYNYPPRFDKEGFTDLGMIALEKIIELRSAMTKTKRLHDKRFKLLEKTPKDNIWRLVYETEYQTEIYFIDLWLKYWKKIGDIGIELEKKQGNFTEEELKRARDYPLENLFEGKLRSSYNRLMGLCPFHEEKTPSFVIYPDNSFHCFGCHAHGNNAIDYLALQGLDFQQAVRRLL